MSAYFVAAFPGLLWLLSGYTNFFTVRTSSYFYIILVRAIPRIALAISPRPWFEPGDKPIWLTIKLKAIFGS